MPQFSSDKVSDWDVSWLGYAYCLGLGFEHPENWGTGDYGGIRLYDWDDKLCCLLRQYTVDCGEILSDHGLIGSCVHKYLCGYGSTQCFLENVQEEDSSCIVTDLRYYLRLQEKQLGGECKNKCCCLRQTSKCRCEPPIDENRVIYKNSGKVCCISQKDALKITDLDSPPGFLSIQERWLCLFCSVNIIPKSPFVEFFTSRLYGQGKVPGTKMQHSSFFSPDDLGVNKSAAQTSASVGFSQKPASPQQQAFPQQPGGYPQQSGPEISLPQPMRM